MDFLLYPETPEPLNSRFPYFSGTLVYHLHSVSKQTKLLKSIFCHPFEEAAQFLFSMSMAAWPVDGSTLDTMHHFTPFLFSGVERNLNGNCKY